MLKKPAGLTIDVEDEQEMSEHSKGKRNVNNTSYSGSGVATAQLRQPQRGMTLGHKKTNSSTVNPLASSHHEASGKTSSVSAAKGKISTVGSLSKSQRNK